MSDKIIFLDVDGVLNKMMPLPNGYFGIDKDNVDVFNWFLEQHPAAKIVISSSWRYLILNNFMSVKGFEALLMTHGVNCHERVIGNTKSDEEIKGRGQQIKEWIMRHNIAKYIIFDDMMWDFKMAGLMPRLVLTNGSKGLTMEKVKLLKF